MLDHVFTDAIGALRDTVELLRTRPLPGLPPLTGGMVGYVSYDMVRHWERLPDANPDEIGVPDMAFLLATDLAVLDHAEGSVLLIANAINYDATGERVDDSATTMTPSTTVGMGESSGMITLTEAFARRFPAGSSWARQALAGIGEAALRGLLRAAQEGGLPVRVAAVRALGIIGGEKVVVPLVHALSDPEAEVRAEAVQSTVMLGRGVVPKLILRLKQQPGSDGRDAIV